MKRYADDYEIQIDLDKKGREKKVAVYRGNFFKVDINERQLIDLRKRAIFLFLFLVALHVAGGFVANRGMYAFYVAIPYVFTFLTLYFLGTGIFRIPRRKRKFHRDEVDLSFNRAKKASLALLIILVIGGIGEIFFIIFFSKNALTLEFLFLSLTLLTIGCAYWIFYLFKGVQVMPCGDENGE